MRKLIWLAFAIGAAELFKREAVKRGFTPSQFLTDFFEKTFYSNKAEEPTPPA